MTKKSSQIQLKQILSSSNPIAEIVSHKDEFFDFIDCYMVGCEHKNFHCEGDVWEHTKLVIQNVVAEEHDWIDGAKFVNRFFGSFEIT